MREEYVSSVRRSTTDEIFFREREELLPGQCKFGQVYRVESELFDSP